MDDKFTFFFLVKLSLIKFFVVLVKIKSMLELPRIVLEVLHGFIREAV